MISHEMQQYLPHLRLRTRRSLDCMPFPNDPSNSALDDAITMRGENAIIVNIVSYIPEKQNLLRIGFLGLRDEVLF